MAAFLPASLGSWFWTLAGFFVLLASLELWRLVRLAGRQLRTLLPTAPVVRPDTAAIERALRERLNVIGRPPTH